MPNQGMLQVLLIVVAAVGSYVLSLRLICGVIVLNCLLIAGHLWFHDAGLQESVTAASFYMILHLAAVFSTYALWREVQVRAELEQKTTELEAASVLLEDSAKTSERLRISRELHDLIGHQLTVLNLELEAPKHREGQQARQHIDQAADVARALLADVRGTVGELREAGPGDLRTVLLRIASAVQSLDVDVQVDDEVTVDEQQAEALVRAGQEIITNAIKHGEAKGLWLTVELDGDQTRLQGTNDGLAPRRVVAGHGLQGLRERVELLGGSLRVSPHPYFTVEVSLPQPDTKGAHR
ncbi:MAG: sensor histidine kinase [Nesterenkonia sp.]